ncbi:hypothetical protein ACHHYP_05956, partial [Achlya hypogyna]
MERRRGTRKCVVCDRPTGVDGPVYCMGCSGSFKPVAVKTKGKPDVVDLLSSDDDDDVPAPPPKPRAALKRPAPTASPVQQNGLFHWKPATRSVPLQALQSRTFISVAFDPTQFPPEETQVETTPTKPSTKRTLLLDDTPSPVKVAKRDTGNPAKRKRSPPSSPRPSQDNRVDEFQTPSTPPRLTKKVATSPPLADGSTNASSSTKAALPDDAEEKQPPSTPPRGTAQAPNILVAKRKRPGFVVIPTVEIVSSPAMKPRKALPPRPSLGECSRKLLQFMQNCDSEDDDSDSNDAVYMTNHVVDLSAFSSDESDLEESADDDDDDDPEESAEDSSYEEDFSRKTKSHSSTGRALVRGTCYLCEEEVTSKKLSVECPDCGGVYHVSCAAEYGHDKKAVVCWECEEQDIIDDDELTDTERDMTHSIFQVFKTEPGTEPAANDVDIFNLTERRRIVEGWRQFFDEHTNKYDADFERITKEIEDSTGFNTTLESDLHKVFQHFTNQQIKAEALEAKGVASGTDDEGGFVDLSPPGPVPSKAAVMAAIFPADDDEPSRPVPERPTVTYKVNVVNGLTKLVEQARAYDKHAATKPLPRAVPPPPKSAKKRVPLTTVPKPPVTGSESNPIAMSDSDDEADDEDEAPPPVPPPVPPPRASERKLAPPPAASVDLTLSDSEESDSDGKESVPTNNDPSQCLKAVPGAMTEETSYPAPPTIPSFATSAVTG